MANTQTTGSGGSNSAVSIQEYSIRVPKNGRKKFHVMRFNATLNVDFTKWTQVKMERENNMKEYKGMDEEQPKFGAGSEFGRESREEARRKKLGFISRSYKPDDQPWILKSGGKTGKKFKGIREGGVSENAAYYVFTHAADGIIEAFPLQEWYNFQPIQRYKALSAEEAEQEFGKRNRVLNYFSLMLRKRLKGDEELDVEEGDDMKGRKGASKKAKDLKISEMDEWMDSSSGDDSSDEEKTEKKENDEEAEDKKKKAKKANVKKTKKNRDTDAEAFEDSDDGDDEGRELDYISSSSESEPEIEKQLQGVAEEKALRKLLTSDEDSEEEENKSEKEESNDEENKAENKNGKDDKESGDKKKKKKKDKKEISKKKKDEKVKEKETSSDSTADSTDSDVDTKKKTKKDDKEANSVVKDNLKESNSATGSRSGSPAVGVANKRKLHNLDNITSKKPKLDTSGSSSSLYIAGSSESGITEDAVRRYLMRKPMTTTELLQKFKTKKTGLSSEQLVNIMTQILKKINPVKQTIKGKMYLSIKA